MEGVIAIIATFGFIPLIVYLRGRHKLEARKLELEAITGRRGASAREASSSIE